jgi:hypothetical protein
MSGSPGISWSEARLLVDCGRLGKREKVGAPQEEIDEKKKIFYFLIFFHQRILVGPRALTPF